MFGNSFKMNAEAIHVHSEFITTVVRKHPQRRTCERTCSICLTVPAIKTYMPTYFIPILSQLYINNIASIKPMKLKILFKIPDILKSLLIWNGVLML